MDSYWSSLFLFALRTLTIRLRISNQNGAPIEIAIAVITHPKGTFHHPPWFSTVLFICSARSSKLSFFKLISHLSSQEIKVIKSLVL